MTRAHLFEQGRMHLEQTLNGEIPNAQEVVRETVRFWVEEVPEELRRRLSSKEVSYSDLAQAERNLKEDGTLIYVRNTPPWLVGRGEHQVVIDVGNGLVAKLPANNYPIPKLGLHITTTFPGYAHVGFGKTNYRFMQETIDNLRKLGYEIHDGQFYHGHWVGIDRICVTPKVRHDTFRKRTKSEIPPPNIFITADLREGDKYKVIEYDDEQARQLPNGSVLVDIFKAGHSDFMQRFVPSTVGISEGVPGKIPPYLLRKPHGPDCSPETAIRKMFLLQIPVNKGEEGKLVIGDLDHVLLIG